MLFFFFFPAAVLHDYRVFGLNPHWNRYCTNRTLRLIFCFVFTAIILIFLLDFLSLSHNVLQFYSSSQSGEGHSTTVFEEMPCVNRFEVTCSRCSDRLNVGLDCCYWRPRCPLLSNTSIFGKEDRYYIPSEMRFEASSGMSHLSDNLWPFNRLGSPKLVAPSVDLFLMRCDSVFFFFLLLKALLFSSLPCCVVEAQVQPKQASNPPILGRVRKRQLNH